MLSLLILLAVAAVLVAPVGRFLHVALTILGGLIAVTVVLTLAILLLVMIALRGGLA